MPWNNTEDKLLVINDTFKVIVKTSEDIIVSIRKYASDNDLQAFTIMDGKPNHKVLDDKDKLYKKDHVIFLSIKEHNRAG